jgi:hypothetical protein
LAGLFKIERPFLDCPGDYSQKIDTSYLYHLNDNDPLAMVFMYDIPDICLPTMYKSYCNLLCSMQLVKKSYIRAGVLHHLLVILHAISDLIYIVESIFYNVLI